MKVSEGLFRKKVLYNKSFLLKRYLGLKERELDLLVEKRVQEPIGGGFGRLEGTIPSIIGMASEIEK
jgi:hypothetical protein